MPSLIHGVAEALDLLVTISGRHQPLRGQLVGIQLACARVLGNLLVHQRLRERRCVLFVVAQTAEANDVDHHVLGELLAELQRNLGREDHRIRVVAVHVQHRRLDHLDHIRTIGGRALVARIGGGEADLVVDDDVDRAESAVAARLGQVQGLHDHALAGEGGIAVHDDGQHLAAVLVAPAIHARLAGAFDHRVDDFQMRRIESQRQVHRSARRRDVTGEALVVLDVASRQVVGVTALELGEQVGRHLAQRIDQHVQTPAMGHSDHDFLDAGFAGPLDQVVHGGDEALTAFQREPLLADIPGVQVFFDAFSRSQLLEDALALFRRIAGARPGRFQALLKPAFLGRVRDVHEFGADGAAVRFAQGAQDVAQRGLFEPEIGVAGRIDIGVVAFAEVVERRFEFGNLRAFLALERVEVRPQRPQETVRGHQLLDVDLLARGRGVTAHDTRLQRAVLGPLGETLHDGRMRDIAGLRIAVGRRNMLEVVEILAPALRDGARVVEVALIQLLDIGRVAAEQIRVRLECFHHGASPFLTSFSLKMLGRRMSSHSISGGRRPHSGFRIGGLRPQTVTVGFTS